MSDKNGLIQCCKTPRRFENYSKRYKEVSDRFILLKWIQNCTGSRIGQYFSEWARDSQIYYLPTEWASHFSFYIICFVTSWCKSHIAGSSHSLASPMCQKHHYDTKQIGRLRNPLQNCKIEWIIIQKLILLSNTFLVDNITRYNINVTITKFHLRVFHAMFAT